MKNKFFIVFVGAFLSTAVMADCSVDYEICEKTCYIKYFNDDAAATGCKSKCIAEKGVCLAKVGADKTVELGEDAWEGTKSFFKGMTEE